MKREKLQARRISRGFTQAVVAEKAGISRAFYSEIESGKKNCAIRCWIKIGAALEIPAEELFSYIVESEKGA